MEDLFQIPNAPIAGGQHHEPRPKKRRKKRIVFWSLCVLLLGALAFTLFAVGRFTSGAVEVNRWFAKTQDAVTELNFEEASENIIYVQNGLEQMRSAIHMLKFAEWIPFAGDYISGLRLTLEASDASVQAFGNALTVIANVYGVVTEARAHIDPAGDLSEVDTYASISPEVKAELLMELHRSVDDLKEIQVNLKIAVDDINELMALELHPKLNEAIEPFQELFPGLIAGMDLLVPFAASVDEIAGLDEDRQWLLLFLNNNELRPGGGFIGVYGLLLMQGGELIEQKIDDSYAVDRLVAGDPDYRVEPPQPLAEYLNLKNWYFRDANWSPDFPTSSQFAVDLMRQELSVAEEPVPEIHGVIGFSINMAEDILEIIGPVEAGGVTFTPENLGDDLEHLVEFAYVDQGIAREDRKDVVGELTGVVLKELFALPLKDWSRVAEAVVAGFDQKKIALTSFNEDTQNVFEDAGWAGSMPNSADDFLMVADANLGALKSDGVVAREINYSIVPVEDERHKATVSITYNHNGEFSETVSRYRTYVRAYVPEGSEFLGASGTLIGDLYWNPDETPDEVTITDELGFSSFGAFTSIEPGASRTVTYQYLLPESVSKAIKKGIYQLHVEKQMGARDYDLTIDLDFGEAIHAAEPAEESSEFGDQKYHIKQIFDTSKDFTIEL